jgi:hypothetical protein
MSLRSIPSGFITQPIGYGPAPAGLEAMLETKTTKTGRFDKRTNAERLLAEYEAKVERAKRIDYRADEPPTNG